MKKLLVLVLVLSIASIANADLTLNVSDTVLGSGGSATISISGSADMGIWFLGISSGADASFDLDSAVMDYVGSDASLSFLDDGDIAGAIGCNNPTVLVSMADTPPPPAVGNPVIGDPLCHGIILNVATGGEFTVYLFDGDLGLVASQLITTPEPITIGLLGLGAMFLRRRK